MAFNSMLARDTVAGEQGECFVTLDGVRYNLMHTVNIEAKIEKTKQEVPLLGNAKKGNKSTGAKGTGSMTIHYGFPILHSLLVRYFKTGEDFYFDTQITNEDITSATGRQTVILKDCNIDSSIIAKLDADSAYIDEDIDFTFEDIEMPEEFTLLDGVL